MAGGDADDGQQERHSEAEGDEEGEAEADSADGEGEDEQEDGVPAGDEATGESQAEEAFEGEPAVVGGDFIDCGVFAVTGEVATQSPEADAGDEESGDAEEGGVDAWCRR